VVACARHGEPPPPELTLAWDCERWKTLPDAGGLYDQEYALMQKMDKYQSIYRTVAKLSTFRGKNNEGIHSLTDSERRLIKSLMDSGVYYG